jgi:hypothetical protein
MERGPGLWVAFAERQSRFDFGCATVPDLATVLPAKGLKADTARGRQNSGLHHHRREIIRDGSQDFVIEMIQAVEIGSRAEK